MLTHTISNSVYLYENNSIPFIIIKIFNDYKMIDQLALKPKGNKFKCKFIVYAKLKKEILKYLIENNIVESLRPKLVSDYKVYTISLVRSKIFEAL